MHWLDSKEFSAFWHILGNYKLNLNQTSTILCILKTFDFISNYSDCRTAELKKIGCDTFKPGDKSIVKFIRDGSSLKSSRNGHSVQQALSLQHQIGLVFCSNSLWRNGAERSLHNVNNHFGLVLLVRIKALDQGNQTRAYFHCIKSALGAAARSWISLIKVELNQGIVKRVFQKGSLISLKQ